MPAIEVAMPWPPSTNKIWRNVGKRTLLSKEARVYRNRARGELLAQGGHLRGVEEAPARHHKGAGRRDMAGRGAHAGQGDQDDWER